MEFKNNLHRKRYSLKNLSKGLGKENPKKKTAGEGCLLEEYPRHLIVVTMKKQKLEEEGKSTNECTVNKSLNCIISFGAVHCNKDHINSFAMFSKENYAE